MPEINQVKSKSKNISVLHIASGDLWAGAEVQMYTLVKTLNNNLHVPVTVVLLNHGKLERELKAIGINVYILDESQLNGLQIFFSLFRLIRRLSPDIIHTHRIKENILGSIAALLAGNISSLRTTHGSQEHPPSWLQPTKRLKYFLNWYCARFLQNKIIAVSDDLGVILKNDLPANKVIVIENGIDFEHITSQRHYKCDEPGETKKHFTIGVAGRLVPVKRLDIFIATARYMLDHHSDMKLRFHIYGEGPLLNELSILNDSLKTKDVVYFEGHCEHIVQKLTNLDALLMTSDHEGMPMILLEAMTLQVPIIAHAVGGIPSLLDQGSCGILVHDHTSAGYGEAIFQLLSQPDRQVTLKNNAYHRVRSVYSAENNALAYLSEYSLIANR